MSYTTFVALQTLMLNTKFQRNWPSGSGEIFKGFEHLMIFEHDGHLGHVNWTIYTLIFPLLKEAPNKI